MEKSFVQPPLEPPDFLKVLQGLQLNVQPAPNPLSAMPVISGQIPLTPNGLSLGGSLGPPPRPGMPVDWGAMLQFNRRF